MNLSQPPPFPITQTTLEDESQLNLLSVFHYVLGGIYCLGILFLILHFGMMAFIFKTVEAEQSTVIAERTAEIQAAEEIALPPDHSSSAEAPAAPTTVLPTPAHSTDPFPKEMIWVFSVFYLVMGAFILTFIICNILSARLLKKRKNRTFSLITAGLNCCVFPFGTVLGVFTFIVLSRQTVKMSYEARQEA